MLKLAKFFNVWYNICATQFHSFDSIEGKYLGKRCFPYLPIPKWNRDCVATMWELTFPVRSFGSALFYKYYGENNNETNYFEL